MRNRTVFFATCLLSAGVLSAQQPAPPQHPAAPPRGSSGPREHAKVTPINNLPNPFETIRNWGTGRSRA